MKDNNGLKKIVVLLIILVISLIAFLGIYVYNEASYAYENVIPEYTIGMDLKGALQIVFKIDDSEEEIAKDSEGNIIEDYDEEYDEEQEGITIETVKANSEDILTSENFIASRDILEARLKQLQVGEYKIRLDSDNGNLVVEIPKDAKSEVVVSALSEPGSFEIIDSETKEVLLDNSYIASTSAFYNAASTGYVPYLGIKFNKEGTKKLDEISRIYIPSTDEEITDEETEHEEEDHDAKEVTMLIDGEEFMTTSFSEAITTGQLSISLGAATIDEATLMKNLNQASTLAAILGNKEMPVRYIIEETSYLMRDISITGIYILVIALLCVLALSLLYMVIRYKIDGLLGWSSVVGFLAILLLAVRYTNTTITMSILLLLGLMVILDYMFVLLLMRRGKEQKNSFDNMYKQSLLISAPLLVFGILFCFQSTLQISSAGIAIFWGMLTFIVYNIAITRLLFVDKKRN